MTETRAEFTSRLFVVHIPKTAGTSLRNAIQDIYGAERVCGLYPDPRFVDPRQFATLPFSVKERYQVYIGHVTFPFARELPQSLPLRLMTVLRNPMERGCSQYNHMMNDALKGRCISLAELVEKGVGEDIGRRLPAPFDNAQVRYLCSQDAGPGLSRCTREHLESAKQNLRDHFALVGVTERMPETLYLASRVLGWPVIHPRHMNLGREREVDAFSMITERDRAVLAEHNQLDIELYEFANELLSERIRAGGNDWQAELESFLRRQAERARLDASELDGELYLKMNPDVAAAGMDPMTHFIFHGQFEDRDGTPFLSGQRRKNTRACMEPWLEEEADWLGAPCPERGQIADADFLRAARRELRYRLAVGLLDEKCRNCNRAAIVSLPEYLELLQRERASVDSRSVGAMRRSSSAAVPIVVHETPAVRDDVDGGHGLAGDGPRILVVGMAKSGTTIIAHTIRDSLPGAAFSMEPDRISHFEDIASDARARVAKILYDKWAGRPHLLDGLVSGEAGWVPGKTVAIVRDPRDVLVSKLFYAVRSRIVARGLSREGADEWIAVLRRKEESPAELSFADMVGRLHTISGLGINVTEFFERIFEGYRRWITSMGDRLHLLRYEDFVGNDVAALEAYLDFPLSSGREVPEALGRVARSRDAGSWRSVMLPSDVASLRGRYGDLLATWGYADWSLDENPTLSPENCSRYVARIAREAFEHIARSARR